MGHGLSTVKVLENNLMIYDYTSVKTKYLLYQEKKFIYEDIEFIVKKNSRDVGYYYAQILNGSINIDFYNKRLADYTEYNKNATYIDFVDNHIPNGVFCDSIYITNYMYWLIDNINSKKLSNYIVSRIKKSIDDEDTCAICCEKLNSFKYEDIEVLKCGHMYCAECAAKISVCAFCR
jgi:hypothetical protein